MGKRVAVLVLLFVAGLASEPAAAATPPVVVPSPLNLANEVVQTALTEGIEVLDGHVFPAYDTALDTVNPALDDALEDPALDGVVAEFNDAYETGTGAAVGVVGTAYDVVPVALPFVCLQERGAPTICWR